VFLRQFASFKSVCVPLPWEYFTCSAGKVWVYYRKFRTKIVSESFSSTTVRRSTISRRVYERMVIAVAVDSLGMEPQNAVED